MVWVKKMMGEIIFMVYIITKGILIRNRYTFKKNKSNTGFCNTSKSNPVCLININEIYCHLVK